MGGFHGVVDFSPCISFALCGGQKFPSHRGLSPYCMSRSLGVGVTDYMSPLLSCERMRCDRGSAGRARAMLMLDNLAALHINRISLGLLELQKRKPLALAESEHSEISSRGNVPWDIEP
eukprot:gnl/TRDRNA2_/TRDRNA2_140226_c0_seq1.p1 gnl/TRDRNA2_/TRDRNA2_140226_c0~~gnl/TRDRNA2_/TRDRNA2_140226_c0_seq1.p1  ORF type:complete len:119 (+),score=5.88 gnl/TRDRNA2_/TRDRNA2_140226_c0_seq1:107-463(+)